MNLLDEILGEINNPKYGLPEDVFRFISQVTPMVNVDLLIKDSVKGALLIWRDDEFYGPGWHIPGGIVRFKELTAERIEQVAKTELDTTVLYDDKPIEINELMAKDRNIRGHFISMLYSCELSGGLDKSKKYNKNTPINGSWQWFHKCPDEILYQHEVYRKNIDRIGI
jgi:colanic acid biosynthesis protein WcaH